MEGVRAGSAKGDGERTPSCVLVVARKGIDRWNRCQAGGLIVSPVGGRPGGWRGLITSLRLCN